MYCLIDRFCSFFSGVKLFRSAILVAILLYYFAAISSISASERTAWFSDVPLIDRVTVDTQLSFAFDSPSGRVVKFSFHTDFNEQQIEQFYQNVLASLGWQANDHVFERDGEVMMITKTGTASDGSVIYQLSLTPRS